MDMNRNMAIDIVSFSLGIAAGRVPGEIRLPGGILVPQGKLFAGRTISSGGTDLYTGEISAFDGAGLVTGKSLASDRAGLVTGEAFASGGTGLVTGRDLASDDAVKPIEAKLGRIYELYLYGDENLSDGDILEIFDLSIDFLVRPVIREMPEPKQISALAGILSKIAYAAAKKCSGLIDDLNKKKYELMEEKDRIFQELQRDKAQSQVYTGRVKALEAKLTQIEQDIDSCVRDIMNAQNELENIQRKIRKLKKWCWVPFYNIYLYIDAENASTKIGKYQSMLSSAEKEHSQIMTEKEEAHNKILELNESEKNTVSRISANEKAQLSCIQEINDIKAKVIQSSDIALYFGTVSVQLEYCDSDVSFMIESIKKMQAILQKTGSTDL